MSPHPTLEEFEEELRETDDLDQLVNDLFGGGGLPWAFRSDEPTYLAFRERVSYALKTTAEDVHIVGSASVGFSLGPDTYPREFHEYSDIDVAVVSTDLFDTVWFSLLKWGHPRRHSLPAPEKNWYDERQREVFWGWLTPHHLSFRTIRFQRDLQTARDLRTNWFSLFQGMGAQFPDTELARREVSGRLYRTWDHLVGYQSESLRRLRYRIENPVH